MLNYIILFNIRLTIFNIYIYYFLYINILNLDIQYLIFVRQYLPQMQGHIQSQILTSLAFPKASNPQGIGRIILQFAITYHCDLCQSVSTSFMFLRSGEGAVTHPPLFCTRQFVSFLGLETWPGLTWPLPEGRFRLGTGNRLRAGSCGLGALWMTY